MDKKEMDAKVALIASRGGASKQSPTPGGFSQRMAAARAAKKTARPPSQPTAGVSSTAPPNPVVVGKGAKPTHVKQAKTSIPAVKQGKKGPTMQTGSGGHTFNIHIKNS